MEATMLENNSLWDEIISPRSGTAEAITILDGMIIHHGDSLVNSSDTQWKDSVILT
jgi:hypothetical protein